jgi:hypothetical protein
MALLIFWAKEPIGNFTIVREDMLKIMSRQIERWSTYYWNTETKKFTTALDPSLTRSIMKIKRLAIESFNEMITLEKKNRGLTTFKSISSDEIHGYVAGDLLLKWRIIELDSGGDPLYSSIERNINNQGNPAPYRFPQIRTMETFEVL